MNTRILNGLRVSLMPCGKTCTYIICINVGVSVLLWLHALLSKQSALDMEIPGRLLAMPATLTGIMTHPWTPITYMFTHFSFLHLLFNMLWLYWFARILNNLSTRNLLILYIGGGLTGALMFYCFHTTAAPLCGASASVLALMTAAMVLHPNLRLNLFLIGEVRLKWVALTAIFITLTGGDFRPDVLAAHAGGVIFGLAFAICLKICSRGTSNISKPSLSFANRLKKRNGQRMAELAAMRLSDPERLDQLLDKIRISGFESLSPEERCELNEISKKLREK